MNKTNAILNYSLNRFCPMAIVILILLSSFSLNDWKIYALIPLLIFMDKYQFKVGYSVGYCDAKGIDPTEQS